MAGVILLCIMQETRKPTVPLSPHASSVYKRVSSNLMLRGSSGGGDKPAMG